MLFFVILTDNANDAKDDGTTSGKNRGFPGIFNSRCIHDFVFVNTLPRLAIYAHWRTQSSNFFLRSAPCARCWRSSGWGVKFAFHNKPIQSKRKNTLSVSRKVHCEIINKDKMCHVIRF